MKLYVGNPTQQVHEFVYWLPESVGLRPQVIQPGAQVQIAGELSPNAIDNIVRHHTPYGLVKEDEKPPPHVVGLVYSIDRPIRLDRLNGFINHNFRVLVDRGKQARQDAAIQVSEQIEQMMFERQMPGHLKEVQMSVEELNRDPRDQSPEVYEGVAVSRDAPLGKPTTQRRAPRRRA